MTRRLLERVERDERGITLVLFALLLTGFLVIAGLVLDYGLVRSDRQKNKSIADSAAIAGLRALDGGGGIPRPWQGACQAYRYIVANSSELSGLTGSWKTGAGGAPPDPIPCPATGPAIADSCTPNDPSTWAWFDGTAAGGRIKVDIKTGYDISSDSFPDDSLIPADPGDPAQGNCDHLAVIISESQETGFGAITGTRNLTSRIRTVGRAIIGQDGEVPVAMLLLERHDCRVIDMAGSNVRIISKGFGDRPGLIHSDSLGDGANCGKIVEGNFDTAIPAEVGPPPRPACPAPCPRVLAERSETPVGAEAPGVIGVYALLPGAPGAVPGNASTACPNTVQGQDRVGLPGNCPEGRPLVGRGPVDVRYRAHVSALRTDANTRMNWTPAQAMANGFTVVNCAFNPVSGGSNTDSKIYVDCAKAGGTFEFTGPGLEIIFNGDIEFGGGPTTVFSLKDPRTVYVRGQVKITRSLHLNLNGTPNCDARFAQDRSKSTKFVIGGSGFTGTGNALLRACQTFIYLSNGTIPSTNGTLPYANGFSGSFNLSGTGGLDWSGPNVSSLPPTAAQLAEFEDLALWTETEAASSIAGSGFLNMKGIFFLPNANPFTISGGGTQDIGRDAQFISRKVKVAGSAFLTLRPDPANSVLVPYFKDFALVR